MEVNGQLYFPAASTLWKESSVHIEVYVWSQSQSEPCGERRISYPFQERTPTAKHINCRYIDQVISAPVTFYLLGIERWLFLTVTEQTDSAQKFFGGTGLGFLN